MRMRRFAPVLGALVAVTAAGRARGDDRVPPPASAPLRDVPRWRLRATLVQGFGGSRAQDAQVTRFPTTLEVGARIWGPLSLALGVTGTQAGEYDTRCGQASRPSAVAGGLGLRADLGNGRSATWVDPFVEVHGGVGAQAAAELHPGGCPTAVVFGSAGARVGIDVWLGRAAVTTAVGFDYLPVGSSFSFLLGATFAVF